MQCGGPLAPGDRFCPDCGQACALPGPRISPGPPSSIAAAPIQPAIVATETPSAADTTDHNRTQPSTLPSAGRPASIRLVQRGALRGADTFPLVQDGTTIGLAPECDIVIDHDPYISRRHARIGKVGTAWVLEDTGSSNGTFVRVRRPIALEPGDEIVLGTTVLHFEPDTP